MDAIKRGFQDYYYRSKFHHPHHHHQDSTPPLTKTFVAFISITFTIAYVLPLYLFPATRPSPNVYRDSPALIRARIRVVTGACICCSIATIYILSHEARRARSEIFHLLGWYPLRYEDVIKSLSLTMLLFGGPLFERLIVEGGWRRYLTGKPLLETLDSWIGWRNYVAGPFTEEIMFRSLLTSLSLLTGYTSKQTIFITPLYFGVAHIHHFYEFRLTHPRVPISGALINSLFQFTYTTLFGWYANFVFVRTGSLFAVILIHSFCNWMGLPRLWGRVEAGVPVSPPSPAKVMNEDKGPAYRPPFKQYSLSVIWTIVYYCLLIVGLLAFRRYFWILTASTNKLGVSE